MCALFNHKERTKSRLISIYKRRRFLALFSESQFKPRMTASLAVNTQRARTHSRTLVDLRNSAAAEESYFVKPSDRLRHHPLTI